MRADGWGCVDGNEAAARVAHRLSEVIAIYLITPASPMGELADLRALVDDADVAAHRDRGLSPDRPQLRGSAQNPDVLFFQARGAANPFYAAVPEIVQVKLDQLAARTGRRYGLVDSAGAPERVKGASARVDEPVRA